MIAHPFDRVERKPRTCIWEITGACNLRCVHCENNCGERGSRELSLDRMMEVAGDLARLGCRTVDVTGGEPLLMPVWDRLCARIRDLGMQIALITNGTLLTDEVLDRALDSGVGLVAVSIDGLREVHDATRLRPVPGPSPFQEAVAGIERAVPRARTRVITQVNRTNLHQLADMRELIAGLGVESWQLQLAVPTGRVLELAEPYVIHPADLDELTSFIVDAVQDGGPPHIDTGDTIGYYTDREPSLRKRSSGQGMWLGCQAGIRSVAITYDGMVRGCSAMPADFDAGDLHEESLEAIWNDAERFAYSTRFDPRKLTGDCASCRFAALCRAGCTTMAFWVTGTIYENPYCLMSQGKVR
ncbi:MAG: radical SAM protein [Deltaproteobacteria bacterium]|nr:radical SAM protein [Deltaproteobacteria bacterium]